MPVSDVVVLKPIAWCPWRFGGKARKVTVWGVTRDYLMLTSRDDTEGNPAPSLKVARYGSFPFRLACATGDRELTVQVKQPDSTAVRPYMTVRANASIGVSAATATADATTGWQNLTLNFTATGDGGVWVDLWNADPGKPCWFDNLRVT